ncbi:MAG: hypothetical protein WC879_03610 [Melioribacteraceae bacterium]
MKLKREVVGNQVIFRDADTNEIVKTEILNSDQPAAATIPSHLSGLGSVITIIGVILLLLSIGLIVTGLQSSLTAIATLPIGVGLFISSILFFAIAEIVHNSQYQTKLLKKLLEKQ